MPARARVQCAPLRITALSSCSNPTIRSARPSAKVDLGNKIADTDQKADIWDIADGLLAGAVQYWLYSRQPCTDPECEECLAISTAESRLEELRKLMRQFAEESEYFHSPTDRNVGRA
jgi:hypothetical protein